MAELAGIFLEELPPYTSAIREALSGRDAEGVERAAHALKGSVGNLAARRAFDLALELETAGRGGRSCPG